MSVKNGFYLICPYILVKNLNEGYFRKGKPMSEVIQIHFSPTQTTAAVVGRIASAFDSSEQISLMRDIDPAVCQFICNKEGIDINEMLNILNKKSGILGMSGGISSDFRDIEEAAEAGNDRAAKALAAYNYRVVKYIGAYTAAMDGVDAIVFTAGVGENDKRTRKDICSALTFLGIKIDDAANDKRGEEVVISTPDSKVKVMVIPTNEELKIAQETLELVK